MTRTLTRRQAIAGAASSLAVASTPKTGAADGDALPQSAPADVADADAETTYPRCVYMPDDGEWTVAMPVNVHARIDDDGASDIRSAIEDAFTGLSNLRWTRAFPDSSVAAWDSDRGELVAPDLSFRRPRLGDEWVHVHVWTIDDERAGIHAHMDVLDLTASHFHRGDLYDDAVAAVLGQLRETGWRERTPYSIDYGVTDQRLERWGETGDAKVTL